MTRTWLKTVAVSAILVLPLSLPSYAQSPGGQRGGGGGQERMSRGGQQGGGHMCRCQHGGGMQQQQQQGGQMMGPPPPPPMMQQGGMQQGGPGGMRQGGQMMGPPPPMMQQGGRPQGGMNQQGGPGSMQRGGSNQGGLPQAMRPDAASGDTGHHAPRSGFSDSNAATPQAQDGQTSRQREVNEAQKSLERQRLRDRMLEYYDANHDGTLDDSEKKAMLDDLQVWRDNKLERLLEEPTARFVTRWDSDADGLLSQAEKGDARSQIRDHWVRTYGHSYSESGVGGDTRLASVDL